MSDGTKFWGRAALGNNRVTTREIGDIPGITKPKDVFISVPVEVMQKATAERAESFCGIMMELTHKEFMNHPMHYTNVRLSIISNPSNPSYKDW